MFELEKHYPINEQLARKQGFEEKLSFQGNPLDKGFILQRVSKTEKKVHLFYYRFILLKDAFILFARLHVVVFSPRIWWDCGNNEYCLKKT